MNKAQIIKEINALNIKGIKVNDLNLLPGSFVNLEYPFPSGEKVKFLDDEKMYLGLQIEQEGSERCYGIVADEKMLLICEYGENGINPHLILYKLR